MAARKRISFDAELIEGHKGVTPVIVPFDPEAVWGQKPVRLDARRDGWLVEGTINRTRFDGYIGNRWGRFFLIVDAELREALGVSVGDTLSLVIESTLDREVWERARVQARITTAPKKGRSDAIDLDAPPKSRAKRKRAAK
ncbi:MAG: DUF1905 domain-containing protein [Planctomycetes bacterium]|nr:DUF1905 domain-containing protein [Planctomycetota bacterium]